MKKKLKMVFLTIILIGSTPSFAQDHDTLLAKVGNDKITLGHAVLFYQQLSSEYKALPLKEIYPAIVDQLIREAILAQIALNEKNPQLEKSIDNLMRNQIAHNFMNNVIMQNEERLKELYENRITKAPDIEEWNTSHILVKTRSEADELVKVLKNKSDFAALAREKSIGPSKTNGGALGWFSRGMMVPAFEKAVIALKEGEISAPVQTQFGWHVVRLNAKRIKPKATYEEALPELRQIISEELTTEIVAELGKNIAVKRSNTKIDPELLRNPNMFGKNE